MANIPRVSHATLTLTGTAQALSAAYPSVPTRIPLRSLSLQGGEANTGAAYIGGAGVTTTAWGVRIPVPVTSEPAAPFILPPEMANGEVYLDELYAVGAVPGDTLHLLVVAYI